MKCKIKKDKSKNKKKKYILSTQGKKKKGSVKKNEKNKNYC